MRHLAKFRGGWLYDDHDISTIPLATWLSQKQGE